MERSVYNFRFERSSASRKFGVNAGIRHIVVLLRSEASISKIIPHHIPDIARLRFLQEMLLKLAGRQGGTSFTACVSTAMLCLFFTKSFILYFVNVTRMQLLRRKCAQYAAYSTF